MSQLIALIIAIALGAIVTAIGYVFLGDAFTSNSERGVALQLVNQGSQIEMSMTAFRAERAASAFNTDLTTTMTDTNGLATLNYLKDVPQAPEGTYTLVNDADDNVFLVLDAVATELSENVCDEIEELAGRDNTLEAGTDVDTVIGQATGVAGVLAGARYGCYTGVTTAGSETFIFAYEVE